MKKILVIGNVFPEPDSSAAGTKMMQWLALFKENNFDVIYASTAPKSEFSADISLFVKDSWKIKMNDISFDEQVKTFQPDIVLYDRFMTEEQFSWRIRENHPSAIHLLETQDLHFLREAREKNQDFHNVTCKREIASILRCDLTFIISMAEYNFLRQHFPFVTDKISYFPLCYNIDEAAFANKDRENFFFIGNFLHAPNRQAVLFLKKIWHNIRQNIPTAKVYIYGAYPNQQILQLHNENEGFIVKGRVKNIQPIFTQHAILLAPLQFGAGLKGKLLEAMQFGALSITTPIGAEGIASDGEWNGRVVELDDFVAATVAIYQEHEKWAILAKKGRIILESKFTLEAHKTRVLEEINTLSKDINKWRNDHFLSEVMHFHRQQSVKYLSKWIMEKNKAN